MFCGRLFPIWKVMGGRWRFSYFAQRRDLFLGSWSASKWMLNLSCFFFFRNMRDGCYWKKDRGRCGGERLLLSLRPTTCISWLLGDHPRPQLFVNNVRELMNLMSCLFPVFRNYSWEQFFRTQKMFSKNYSSDFVFLIFFF